MRVTRTWTRGIGRAPGVIALWLAGGIALATCMKSETPTGPAAEGLARAAQGAGGPVTPAPLPPEGNSDPAPPGRFVFHGVTLGISGPCPGCTLTLKKGSALVPATAELAYETGGTLSFDQLNALLRPGLPLLIRGDVNGPTNTAFSVVVQAGIHTVGLIDRSAVDVRATGEFIVTVRSAPIEFDASPGAFLEIFPAAAQVDVFAYVVEGNRFLAVRILNH